ncbi:MAG TPA: MaoC/PaaZ C-terminal domain-containing protein [Acidimicrobiales bacterium]|nr:MaoC/PaaZ C-terminal domain-containing protein [Acidimicrobiales bacterium]
MTLRASDLKDGLTFTEVLVEDLTRTQIVQYAGASGDYNPLHTDEVFATKVAGYPSVFAHGMLTMGMTGRALTALVGDGNLRSFGGRFTSQVWPGDDLTATFTVTAVHADGGAGGGADGGAGGDGDGGEPTVDLAVRTTNQDGVEVFSGTATAGIEA